MGLRVFVMVVHRTGRQVETRVLWERPGLLQTEHGNRFRSVFCRVRPNSSISPRAENNLDVIPILYVYCSLFKMLQYLVQAYINMQ